MRPRRFLTFRVWMTEQEGNFLKRLLEAHAADPKTPERASQRAAAIMCSIEQAWAEADLDDKEVTSRRLSGDHQRRGMAGGR